MTWVKSPISSITLSAALLLQIAIPVSLGNFTPAKAENTASDQQQNIPNNWNEFEPPANGAPGRREPGGTRGTQDKPDIIALMPTTSTARTVSGYPSFLFYLPKMSDKPPVEFVLYQYGDDGTQSEFYKTVFRTTGNEGIISLSLPETANLPPLKVGLNYHWYFSVIMNPKDRAADQVVEGWIKRVSPSADLANKSTQSSGIALVEAYQKESLWLDTVATLAEIRRSDPNNLAIAKIWTDILNSVGLQKIAAIPLGERVSPPANLESSNIK